MSNHQVGPFEFIDLPSGDVLYFRESNHSYWREIKPKGDDYSGSGRITGVTTVAKALDTNADPLITWGAKLEAEGVCELLSAASESDRDHLLSNGGDCLHAELVAAKLDWRSVRNARATEGTNVHERIFAVLGRGETPSLSSLTDEERGYGQAAFRAWRALNPDPLAVEQVVYLPRQGVAGRFDLLARIDGEVTLVDAKTSKAAHLSHHVQLAGYRLGCEASGFEVPTRCLILLLSADGEFELVEACSTDEDWDAALTAYTATKRIAKAQRALAKAAA